MKKLIVVSIFSGTFLLTGCASDIDTVELTKNVNHESRASTSDTHSDLGFFNPRPQAAKTTRLTPVGKGRPSSANE